MDKKKAWLGVCTLMVLAMIVLGGYTRVSRSGLSITTWDPILGALPPLGEDAWREAFARYRASPEGTLVNAGMSLHDFQAIYLVEWGHRLLGRLIGLVLGVPLIALLVTRRWSLKRARPLLIVLVAGLGQGVLGWYMVASGLVDAPHVSPFRLTGHLVVGMALLAALAWSALEPSRPARISRGAVFTLVAAFVAITLGALMAGYHAGLVCPTFPKMNGAWIPEGLRLSLADAWTVHFAHRAAAFAVVAFALVFAGARFRGSIRERALALSLAACAVLQLTLGALLVVQHVPPALAVIHQGNAGVLVLLLVALLRDAKAQAKGARASRGDDHRVLLVDEHAQRRSADAA
jgi:heme a synthase